MKLLALDGGGIRGLSSLYILQDIFAKIQFQNDDGVEPLPCDYFDMICGTSTGGIIALMLGRLRMSVSECIKAYLEMSAEVFAKPNGPNYREKFNPRALEEAIQTIVQQRLGDKDALLMDNNNNKPCKTFVCTFDRKDLGGSPVLLRTYPTASALIPCTIWEAARATSAAPTFFPPVEFREQQGIEYIDAGVGCNNPTKELLKEARSYMQLKGADKVTPTCLVSVGTGEMDLIQLQRAVKLLWFNDRMGISIAKVLKDIVTDCDKTHDEVALVCKNENITDRYFRFNATKGMQHIVLDEWDKAGDIKSATNAYLKLNETQDKVRRCVKLLPDQARDVAGCSTGYEESVQVPRRIVQGDNTFLGPTSATNGSQIFQGNFSGMRFGHFAGF